MSEVMENQIASAFVAALEVIKRPDYRVDLFVRRGITQAVLNGTDRPVACVLVMAHDDMPKVGGKRHEITLDVVVYLETADMDNADEELSNAIDDIRTALYAAETLGGLLYQPLWMKGSRRIVDPSGQAGIGSAEITIEAKYRLTHA